MSAEEKKSRSLADVTSQYQQMCVRAGHLQYEISIKRKDLDMLNEQLRDLNLEAASIKAKEAQAKADEAKAAAEAAQAAAEAQKLPNLTQKEEG